MKQIDSGKSYNKNLIPFLAAMCFFLSAVEYAVPKPLPFMRIGFANLPIIFALFKLPACDVAFLVLLKVAGQGIISGTLFSYVFVFSAAGSISSALCMFAAKRLGGKRITAVGIGLAGALGNNCAQIAVARILLFGESTRYIAPLLLASGLASGLALGIFARIFMQKSAWFSELDVFAAADETHSVQIRTEKPEDAAGRRKNSKDKSSTTAALWFVSAVVLMLFFLFQKKVQIQAVCLAFFALLVRIRKGKVKIVSALFLIGGVAFFALLSPFGKVLFYAGKFPVTAGALEAGLRRGIVLVGMLFLSRLAVSSELYIPGRAGQFLRKVFACFKLLTAEHIPLKYGSIISALDRRLADVWRAVCLDFSDTDIKT